GGGDRPRAAQARLGHRQGAGGRLRPRRHARRRRRRRPGRRRLGRRGNPDLSRPRRGWGVRILKGHRRRVRVTAYAPGGTLLATASQDGSVRLWDVMEGTCLLTLPAALRNPAAAFTADGTTLAWRAPGRRLRLWGLKAGAEREPPREGGTLRVLAGL